MSEPALLGYTGAITGIIGSITGIAGLIMGYAGYRRSLQLKALDLRLELRKAENNLRRDFEDLDVVLNSAKKSRTAVSAATGKNGSGAMQAWLSDFEVDSLLAASHNTNIPKQPTQYSSLSHSELETKLVELHALHLKIASLKAKYEASLSEDNLERERIQNVRELRTQTLLRIKEKS